MRIPFGAPAAVSAMLLTTTFGTSAEAQTVTPQEQACANIPGNEFSMRFTSVAAPQGRMVIIDPDDMMLINYPQGSTRRILVPRYNFMESINSGMPPVAGMESAARPSNGCTVEGRSVVTMHNHLVSDHRIPKEQIDNAMKEVYRRRGVPFPGQ